MDALACLGWAAAALGALLVAGLAAVGALALTIVLSSFNAPKLPFGRPAPAMQPVPGKQVVKDLPARYCVLLIGASINSWWDVATWWPVSRAFAGMVTELRSKPQLGYLGGQAYFGNPALSIQYWESMDALMAYARSPEGRHLPVWTAVRRGTVRAGTVGLFHEAYEVQADRVQLLYENLPPWGMGAVRGVRPAKGKAL